MTGFDTASVWVSPEQEDLLTEQLTVRAFVSADVFRLMDVTVRLRALAKPVTFGDTKEGGILSVRVRPSMEVKRGGTITNAHGGTNEKETWGKRAVWCDYTGESNGRTAGIGLMDHPNNLRHPTYWHVRDYGLMTANPFGISHFKDDSSQRGDWVLPAGEEVVFRYRALIHLGAPRDVGLSDRYYDWVSPMQSTWEHGDGPH
jgi:hypothetical protein